MNHLSDEEFVRMYMDSASTETEKSLFERLKTCMEDLQSARDEVRACGPDSDDAPLEDFNTDDLVCELRSRFFASSAETVKSILSNLTAGMPQYAG